MKKVDILLSIYKPNLNYLKKQLDSLNEQDYENIEVFINDDCPQQPCNPSIFKECLTKVKYRVLPQDIQNLGYTKSFEKLLSASDGDYIAFCDQDDIWFSNKISSSVVSLQSNHALLVASDRQIIDENDTITCESVREQSNKIQENWKTGDDISKYNFFTTFAIGMVLVADGNFARSTIPFSTYTGHDKWMIACACAEGKVAFINEALVQYRRHSKNVSGVLVGIHSKKDYEKLRIDTNLGLISDFLKKYPDYKDRNEVLKFAQARKKHNIIDLYRYRYLAPDIAKFDLILSCMPNIGFKCMIYLARKLSK